MKTFKTYIEERYVNLLPHHEDEKRKHAPEVHAMLQKAYAKIGGIHGSGFKDHEDMVKNLPMWKLHKKNGKIHSVALYKDRGGRKRVAVATDGSDEGKKGLGHIMKDDITRHRAYNEVSGPSLKFLKHHVHNVKDYAMHHDDVKKHLEGEEIRKAPDDDEEVVKHPELKHHFYQRQIGGHWHTKIMLGTAGKKIK